MTETDPGLADDSLNIHRAYGALMSYYRALDHMRSGRIDIKEITRSEVQTKLAGVHFFDRGLDEPLCQSFLDAWQCCVYLTEKSGTLDSSDEIAGHWCAESLALATLIEDFRQLACVLAHPFDPVIFADADVEPPDHIAHYLADGPPDLTEAEVAYGRDLCEQINHDEPKDET